MVQREGMDRTHLAWQRTALAVVAGAAILTRLTLGRIGFISIAALCLAGGMGGWLAWEVRRRSRSMTDVSRRDGLAPFLLTGAACVMAGTELAALGLSR